MKFTLQILGSALMTAGLMATAQAAAVSQSLSAIIDFEDLVIAPATRSSSSSSSPVAADGSVTTQYARFGLQFSGPNVVTCSQDTGDRACTAPLQIFTPPHGGRNFLMNQADANGFYSGFSINILPGFSLSTLRLDLARKDGPFTIKFFDANDVLLSTPISEQTSSDFRWTVPALDLGAVDSAVRRIDFGGDPSSRFAIDNLSFDYTAVSTNVPEPAMLSLVALALAGVRLTRRRA